MVGDCNGDGWRECGWVARASVKRGGSRGVVAKARSCSTLLPKVAGMLSRGEGDTTLSELS
jgi:hypothetical protein